MKIPEGIQLDLSGQRFSVDYSIFCLTEKEAMSRAREVCVEETVEFPEKLIPEGDIKNNIVGKVEHIQKVNDGHYLASISFAVETSSNDLVQLLNILYGNISMAPGIRVESVTLPDALLKRFNGPRFGMNGIRELLGVRERPILSTAIKPMGLSPVRLGEMAYEMAIGGIDIIKDDHGLANQSFCPFEERIDRVTEAIAKANHETGRKSLYLPNITAPTDLILKRAQYAKKTGADGFLLISSLVGWDTMRWLADIDELQLPIMCHPAFYGIYYQSKKMGFSAKAIYGQIPRLAGADAVIFPNYIGRFPSTKADCLSVIHSATQPMGKILPTFPCPGGGLTLDRFPEYKDVYGKDVIYLMGGGLHHGESLVDTCRQFRKMVENIR
ncbi:MAG: ribulose 1,5-bisphosphate carboxylase large subunit [Leptolinea sp.]|jgi:ribulose-bisphosphate carboxylase large chain|nr:ribulose 1,5-bisphosphate carboxylase large subunit [Leptolinea sp.]